MEHIKLTGKIYLGFPFRGFSYKKIKNLYKFKKETALGNK